MYEDVQIQIGAILNSDETGWLGEVTVNGDQIFTTTEVYKSDEKALNGIRTKLQEAIASILS